MMTLLTRAQIDALDERNLAGHCGCRDLIAHARASVERMEVLEKALENLVRINEQHNEATKKVIQVSPFWNDNYLDEARTALSALAPTTPKGEA